MNWLELNHNLNVSFVALQVRHIQTEKENDSLNPPSEWLARLSAKKTRSEPRKRLHLPSCITSMPSCSRVLMSLKKGFKTKFIPCFSMIGRVAMMAI